jgi:hypothetical protein
MFSEEGHFLALCVEIFKVVKKTSGPLSLNFLYHIGATTYIRSRAAYYIPLIFPAYLNDYMNGQPLPWI